MFTDNFRDISQDGVAIDHSRRRILQGPFLADHPLRVDKKKRPHSGHYFLVEDSVRADYLPFNKVAQ